MWFSVVFYVFQKKKIMIKFLNDRKLRIFYNKFWCTWYIKNLVPYCTNSFLYNYSKQNLDEKNFGWINIICVHYHEANKFVKMQEKMIKKVKFR